MLLLYGSLAILSGVLSWNQILAWRERKRHPPPGRIVPVLGSHMHLVSRGEGGPAVVLDSALAGTSLSWGPIQAALAAHTRVVAYDRLGFGWSAPTSSPRTVEHMTAELRSLLIAADVPGPYVLVGHSYGGWVAQLFAARFPDDVSGLVLVDTPHPREWAEPSPARQARAAAGVTHALRAVWIARLGLMRPLLWWLARRRNEGPPDGGTDVRALLERTPEEIRGPLKMFWVRARTLCALASQIEHASRSASAVLSSLTPMGDRPLVALTAADPSTERFAEQLEVVGLSERGRHVIAQSSGHWIPLDEPELIVDAVLDVLALAKDEEHEPRITRDEDAAFPPVELRAGVEKQAHRDGEDH